jgi:hypothetical protein
MKTSELGEGAEVCWWHAGSTPTLARVVSRLGGKVRIRVEGGQFAGLHVVDPGSLQQLLERSWEDVEHVEYATEVPLLIHWALAEVPSIKPAWRQLLKAGVRVSIAYSEDMVGCIMTSPSPDGTEIETEYAMPSTTPAIFGAMERLYWHLTGKPLPYDEDEAVSAGCEL